MITPRVSIAVTLAFAVAIAGAAASGAATAPVTKCPKGKVTRVASGKRSCVPVARFRAPTRPPATPSGSSLTRALTGGAIPIRLRNGSRPKPPLPAATITQIAAGYSAAETQALTLIRNALNTATSARLNEIGTTGGVVTTSADGSSASATVGFGGTAGNTAVSGSLDFTGHTSGRLDVGFNITVAQPDGSTKTTGLTARDILSRSQECPDAAGKLPITRSSNVTTRSGETFGAKRVHLGTVREATTSTATARGSATFGPDGKAQPFNVTVNVTYDSSRSAQALAFFQSRQRVVGSGTMTARLDPKTGNVSNVTVTSKGHATGYPGSKAAVDAQVRALIEGLIKDELGRLLEELREAEKKCTGPFEVTLAVTTTSNFATHTATGTLNATVAATKSAPGEFTGSVPMSYQNLVFASKTHCPYIAPIAMTAPFDVKITVQPDGFLKVSWSAGNTMTSASIDCPPEPMGADPPPIPGQSGPTLIQPSPTEFTLPNTGGEQAVGGGLTDAGDGWTHAGTIKVARKTT